MAQDVDEIIEYARRLAEEQIPTPANPCILAQLKLPKRLKTLYEEMCKENPEETIAAIELLALRKHLEALVKSPV